MAMGATDDQLAQPTASAPSIHGQPSASPRPSGRTLAARLRWKWIVAASGCVLAACLGVILLIPTARGVIRIEVLDPSLTVQIEDEEITITDGDEADGQPIHIRVGDHKLRVERDGMVMDTVSFSVSHGQNPTLRVTWLDGKAVVVAGERRATIPLMPKPAVSAPDDVPVVPSPPAASNAFGGRKSIVAPADWANSVSAADIDGDGDLDVLSASFNDDQIAWYENGTGSPGELRDR
jgi:hypothetical protein